MAKNTRKGRKSKPPAGRKTTYPLPYPDFPLSPHVPTNRWYKTIRGKRHYFGPLDDWRAALERWQAERDDLMLGRIPASRLGGRLTLEQVSFRWLDRCSERMLAGKIAGRTFDEYRSFIAFAAETIGRDVPVEALRPADFAKLAAAIHKRWSPTNARKAITIARMMFRWAAQSELIDREPRYGPDFTGPTKLEERAARRARNTIYTADQVRRLIDGASVPLKAMVLLGINGGYTQREVAGLRLDELDLDEAVIDHVRPKTGARRTVPLWPETVEAIRAAIAERPVPKTRDADDLVFVTKRYGQPWVRLSMRDPEALKGNGAAKSLLRRSDAVNLEFRKVADEVGVEVAGAGFGRLRHTHRTISDGANDLHAALRIVGHEVPGISSHYVTDIDLDRLRAVSEHVRGWVFGGKAAAKKKRKIAKTKSR